MDELNRGDPNAPEPCDFYVATVVDEDHIELNQINAAGFGEYRSGGVLTFFEPVDMTDMTGTIALFDDPAEDPVLEAALDIDATANTIDVVLTDERSEERRVGKEGVRTCRSRWSPYK